MVDVDHGWTLKKMFHSRLPKTALQGTFFTFYLTEKCHINLYYKTFIKKELY